MVDFGRADQSYKVATVYFGKAHWLAVYAYREGDPYGCQTVGVSHDRDLLNEMRPEDADHVADALKLAAQVARGQIERQPPLVMGKAANDA